jgi:hypothetical protein
VGDCKRRAITDAGRVVERTDPLPPSTDADEQERRAPSAVTNRGEWLWNYDADAAFEEALASSPLSARAV